MLREDYVEKVEKRKEAVAAARISVTPKDTETGYAGPLGLAGTVCKGTRILDEVPSFG